MAKLTVQDLKNLREKTQKDTSLRSGQFKAKVIVHMSTCGISAGAREVMTTLMEEMAQTDRQDIQVTASSCIGMCTTEPNVTIEIEGDKPVIYQQMDSNKMRQVFRRHILKGEVQTEFALARA